MPLYAVSYTVAGSRHFPLDMLRYDGSHPATGEDTRLLEEAVTAQRDVLFGITLRHVSPTAKWLPTAERWKSFEWYIVPGSIRVQRL